MTEDIAARVRRNPDEEHDIEQLVKRLREARAAALPWKRVCVWAQELCIIAVGAVLLAFATMAWLVLFGIPPIYSIDVAAVIVVGYGGGVLGLTLMSVGTLRLISRLNRLAKEAD
jgi:hypothetical protein